MSLSLFALSKKVGTGILIIVMTFFMYGFTEIPKESEHEKYWYRPKGFDTACLCQEVKGQWFCSCTSEDFMRMIEMFNKMGDKIQKEMNEKADKDEIPNVKENHSGKEAEF